MIDKALEEFEDQLGVELPIMPAVNFTSMCSPGGPRSR
jgi:hypothetical protein